MINISVANRLGNFGDTLLDVEIREDSITWGGVKRDMKSCLNFPANGHYKRSNEESVLPHTIGCQRPSKMWEYQSVLKGKRLIKKCTLMIFATFTNLYHQF